MPVLRNGDTADNYSTPDIYVEEQVPEVPEAPGGVTTHLMAVVGQFQKGPVNDLLVVSEQEFKKILGDFTDTYPGSKAAWTAFKRGVKRLAVVNLRGAGAAKSSATLMDRAAVPVQTMTIRHKHLSEYGNTCTYEVQNGTTVGTFRIVLTGPLTAAETYDNLTSVQEAVDTINAKSAEFEAENLNSASAGADAFPANALATALAGGSDGAALVEADYIGTTNAVTGEKTGLELLKTSAEVTDAVYDQYVSEAANQTLDDVLQQMNGFAYLNAARGTTIANAIAARSNYDTEHAHLALGYAKSKTRGWWVPIAVHDCIAHVLSPVQDGTAGFTFMDVESIDVALSQDDVEALSQNHIVSMSQKIVQDGQTRKLAFGLTSDYTLSANKALRQTYRRRVQSFIERDLFVVLDPYRSKHLSEAVISEVATIVRSYMDGLRGKPGDINSEIIQNYSISFRSPEEIGHVDELIKDLVVDLYNIADKIRIRLYTAADAIKEVA